MATHLRTQLVLQALEMATVQRKPKQEVIHHSDQGSQYTAVTFGHRCEELGVRPPRWDRSAMRTITPWRRSPAEAEPVVRKRRRSMSSHSSVAKKLFEWIEGWYNSRRLHSSLGYRSPSEFERMHAESERGLTWPVA